MSRTGALLSLQRLDERIAGLTKELAGIEKALAGDEELDRRRQQLVAAGGDRQGAEETARGAEAELATARHRARQLEKRLYDGSVRNPQELMGMQHELDGLRPQLERLEAQLLERMEETEAADTELAAAAAAVTAREGERQALAVPRQERLTVARQELEEVLERRAAAVAEIDPADMRTFERVAARRAPAVVRIEGESCGGCHLPLGTHEVRQARQGDVLVQCSNCDRILVA